MQRTANSLEIANGRSSGTERDSMPKYLETDVVLSSVMICRLKVPLNYGNAELFMTEVLSIVRIPPPGLRWLILRFDSIVDVDYVAARMLMELADRMGRKPSSTRIL